MAICSPRGDQTTLFLMVVLFSPMENTCLRVCTSPTRTRRSLLAEAMRRPSGDHATEKICPLWVFSVSILRVNERMLLRKERLGSSFVGSQMCTLRSLPAEATRRPSGDHATALTSSLWPRKVISILPVLASQVWTVPSSLAVARYLLSCDHARALTCWLCP